jgi:hypothetical protein
MANLSKSFKLDGVKGIIRTLAKSISQQELLDTEITDIIHLSLLELVELLGDAVISDYTETATVNQSNNEITLSMNYDKIVKLVDGTNGLVLERSPADIEGTKTHPQSQKNIFYSVVGDKLELYKGTGIGGSYGTLTLYYTRTPNKAGADTEYLDIKDKFVSLLVGKAKIAVYEALGKSAPSELQEGMTNKILAIKQADRDELAAVKK